MIFIGKETGVKVESNLQKVEDCFTGDCVNALLLNGCALVPAFCPELPSKITQSWVDEVEFELEDAVSSTQALDKETQHADYIAEQKAACVREAKQQARNKEAALNISSMRYGRVKI